MGKRKKEKRKKGKNKRNMKKTFNINKKLNNEKIIAILFIFIIFYMFIGTLRENHSAIKLEIKKIFKNDKQTTYQNIAELTSKAENIFNENILFKSSYINIYGLTQNVIGKKYVEDSMDRSRDIVKTKDNMISFVQPKLDMVQKAEGIINLNNELQGSDISFIYIQAPYKIRDNSSLPTGVKDYGNENANILLEELQKESIKTDDLREYFKDWDIKEEFFITDHHWRIKTAFAGANYISEILNEKYNFNIDTFYTDLNNYNVINKGKIFLGSIGKRIGKYYNGVDDFEYILPKYETNLKVKKEDEEHQGTFYETVISQKLLDEKDIITNRYACYFGRDYSEIIINNNNVENDNKILIIQDSYGLPFSAMMSLRVKEVRVIDLRHFKENEIEYIKNYNPDIVLMIYNPSMFSVENAFDFE